MENWCEKHSRLHGMGLISFQEYADILTMYFVFGHRGPMEEYINSIPPELVGRYLEYLRALLEPADFMPLTPTSSFVMPSASGAELEAKRHEMRGAYVRLYELISERAKAVS
jgi:hypothetical protein